MSEQAALQADFTEDVDAGLTIQCARKSCGKTILPDEPRGFIQSKTSGAVKKFCDKCYQEIAGRPTTVRTTVRTTLRTMPAQPKSSNTVQGQQTQLSQQHPQQQVMGSMGPPAPPQQGSLSARGQAIDVQTIRQNVNHAQRKDSDILSRQTVPLPRIYEQVQGATVPGIDPNLVNQMLRQLGYSESHGQYFAERNEQASKAYARPSVPTAAPPSTAVGAFPPTPLAMLGLGDHINLLVQFGHEVGSGAKPKIEVIGGIQEGCDHVPAKATPPQLCNIAWSKLEPRIVQFLQGFPLDRSRVTVREIPSWVSLSGHPSPSSPFFFNLCYTKGKGGVETFKKPRTIPTLALVMDEHQWFEYQNYQGSHESVKPDRGQENSDHEVQTAMSTASRGGFMRKRARMDIESPEIQKKMAAEIAEQNPPPSQRFKTARTGMKDLDVGVSAPRTPSPPPLKRVVEYTSPDAKQLEAALVSGGSQRSSAVHMAGKHLYDAPRPIQYYAIPQVSLSVLLSGGEKCRFSLNYASAQSGILVVETQKSIGQGATKTAHMGLLTVNGGQPGQSGLGTAAQQPVAAKRFYVPQPPESTNRAASKEAKISRLPYEQELSKVFDEGNLLFWATSLMKMAYDWIDKELQYCKEILDETCPYEIFRLRFVYAGVATMSQDFSFRPKEDQSSGASGSHTFKAASAGSPVIRVSPGTVYLIEEFIPCRPSAFTKYVHNADAVPALPSFAGRDYEVAEFLCFIQHLQYIKSKGLVFLSDFQGAGNLLTDPQLMTAPALGNTLFGDGNVNSAFVKFPDQHVCNKYCRWFDLDALPGVVPTQLVSGSD